MTAEPHRFNSENAREYAEAAWHGQRDHLLRKLGVLTDE